MARKSKKTEKPIQKPKEKQPEKIERAEIKKPSKREGYYYK